MQTACCDEPFPSELTVSINGTDIVGTLAATAEYSAGVWSATVAHLLLELFCDGGTWSLRISCDGGTTFSGFPADVVDCEFLTVGFSAVGPLNCGGNSYNVFFSGL